LGVPKVDGRIIGLNCVLERNAVSGLGPPPSDARQLCICHYQNMLKNQEMNRWKDLKSIKRTPPTEMNNKTIEQSDNLRIQSPKSQTRTVTHPNRVRDYESVSQNHPQTNGRKNKKGKTMWIGKTVVPARTHLG
jgi:hypothetical protein